MAYADIGNTMFIRLLEHERARQMEQRAAEQVAFQNLAGASKHIASMKEADETQAQKLAQTESQLAAQTGQEVPQYEDPTMQRYRQVGAMAAQVAQQSAQAQAQASTLKHERALEVQDLTAENRLAGQIDLEETRKDLGHSSYVPSGQASTPTGQRIEQVGKTVDDMNKALQPDNLDNFLNPDKVRAMDELRTALIVLQGQLREGLPPPPDWDAQYASIMSQVEQLTGTRLASPGIVAPVTPTAPAPASTTPGSMEDFYRQQLGK